MRCLSMRGAGRLAIAAMFLFSVVRLIGLIRHELHMREARERHVYFVIHREKVEMVAAEPSKHAVQWGAKFPRSRRCRVSAGGSAGCRTCIIKQTMSKWSPDAKVRFTSHQRHLQCFRLDFAFNCTRKRHVIFLNRSCYLTGILHKWFTSRPRSRTATLS